MPDPRRIFGTQAERQVAAYLVSKGYQVLAQQFKTVFGEVDLICKDGDEIVFVEVKARSFSSFGYPEESVGVQKLKKIVRSAQVYLGSSMETQSWRIDVVSMETGKGERITHLINVDIPDGFW